MKLLDKFRYFKNNTKERKKIQDIIDKLPDNEIIAKQILAENNNTKTKIVLDGDIKNSYYIFLNDTIYLSNKNKASTRYSRLCLIAHECKHSLQSKILQVINFLISNIELIFFVLFAILGLLNFKNSFIPNIYYITVILSIIPRLILEFDAVYSSVRISEKYVEQKLSKDEADIVHLVYSFQVKVLVPMLVFSLVIWKAIRSIIIFVIYKYV